jgi:hypothetical protein
MTVKRQRVCKNGRTTFVEERISVDVNFVNEPIGRSGAAIVDGTTTPRKGVRHYPLNPMDK